jgi:hypothetical protein
MQAKGLRLFLRRLRSRLICFFACRSGYDTFCRGDPIDSLRAKLISAWTLLSGETALAGGPARCVFRVLMGRWIELNSLRSL